MAQDTAAETGPLADERAEADVVGSLLLADGQQVDEILAVVAAEDLWRGAHRTIVEAVAELRRDGHPTDPTAVARRLADRGDLDAVGGHVALAELAHRVPSPASGAWYAWVVADLARRRQVQLHATAWPTRSPTASATSTRWSPTPPTA